MNTRKNRAGSLVIGLAATGFAAIGLAAPAAAAEPPQQAVAHADLDGDGTPETVTLTMIGDGTQQLTADVGGRQIQATMPGDDFAGAQPIRVTDLNADGRAELVITKSVGANTLTFDAWDYDGEFRRLGTPDGQPLDLYEGGGVAARVGYTCEATPAGRALVTLGSEADDVGADPLTYTGARTAYTLQDGVLTPAATVPFTSVAPTDPLVSTDPAACA
ncbi:hypothetical protein [Amycolatopsis nigrescens]|uniref:hypothetical protein n=1 Tax=Amycolatopsis nigrescens TaxID=381445 RepID=UPI0003818078|nr:hypothetical protein [Amycolatopsis nigrescens]